MENNKSNIYTIEEKDLEIFGRIINIRHRAKKELGHDMTLDQAIAMYLLSSIMGGAYFIEMKCPNCKK